MRRVSHPAWVNEPETSQGISHEYPLPAMPYALAGKHSIATARRAGSQPIAEISGVHDVSRVHPWVECQRGIFQTLTRSAQRLTRFSHAPKAGTKSANRLGGPHEITSTSYVSRTSTCICRRPCAINLDDGAIDSALYHLIAISCIAVHRQLWRWRRPAGGRISGTA